MARKSLRLIDIAVNLTDPMFRGIYNSSQKHSSDLKSILSRAVEAGVSSIIVTGTNKAESEEAIKLVDEFDSDSCKLFSTVGCHPTWCLGFEENPDDYMNTLRNLISSSKKVVAVGEIGLDYDRLQFCPKDVQLKYFEKQLSLAEESSLPLFLHCRSAASDLWSILNNRRDTLKGGGVVHSFDGTMSEAQSFIDLGYYIGLNGCSLKTDNNFSVVKELPLDKILLETDAPWCDIRPTHASYKYVQTKPESKKKEKFQDGFQVKGRNEPCNIVQVLEVVAAIKEMSIEEVAKQTTLNAENVFKLG